MKLIFHSEFETRHWKVLTFAPSALTGKTGKGQGTSVCRVGGGGSRVGRAPGACLTLTLKTLLFGWRMSIGRGGRGGGRGSQAGDPDSTQIFVLLCGWKRGEEALTEFHDSAWITVSVNGEYLGPGPENIRGVSSMTLEK